jgi:predicted PurR-regulated permease PerM
MPEPVIKPPKERRRRNLLAPLLTFLLIVLFLAVLVFHHFFLTFTVAAAVGVFLGPLQKRLTRWLGGRPGIAAGLLVVMTTLVILVPVLGSATLLSQQAVGFIEWARPRLQPAALKQLWQETLPTRYPSLQEWLDFESPELPQFLSEGLSQAVAAMNGLIQGTVSGLTSAFFELVLFLMMLFFLLRDGGRLRAEFRRISPFSGEQEDQIADHIGRTVKGVLQAMVMVPVAQGLVAYLGFWIFGVPAPLLWSVMVVLAALIPLVGSPLAWIPACGYLFFYGATWQWVGMVLYGALLISTIDNVIKPLLLRDAARIHPLLGFLSILGGLMSFGPLGFLVGPVIASLVLSALRIYRLDVLRPRPELKLTG